MLFTFVIANVIKVTTEEKAMKINTNAFTLVSTAIGKQFGWETSKLKKLKTFNRKDQKRVDGIVHDIDVIFTVDSVIKSLQDCKANCLQMNVEGDKLASELSQPSLDELQVCFDTVLKNTATDKLKGLQALDYSKIVLNLMSRIRLRFSSKVERQMQQQMMNVLEQRVTAFFSTSQDVQLCDQDEGQDESQDENYRKLSKRAQGDAAVTCCFCITGACCAGVGGLMQLNPASAGPGLIIIYIGLAVMAAPCGVVVVVI